MKIIGLTGGIASGKNFVADIFRNNGAAIFDADLEVHKLLESDQKTILDVSKAFSESVIDGKIDRKILGNIVFNDKNKLKTLETIIHPIIRQKYLECLDTSISEGREMLLLNIPLLLESKNYECDKIIAITISRDIQKERFLERARKSDPDNFIAKKLYLEKKFEQIILSQIGNAEREEKADFVINNDVDLECFEDQVQDVIADII